MNYTGIIFGNEISFDSDTKSIKILPENYHDKNGKQSISDPNELKDFILNIYKTLMLRGIRGTFIFVNDPKLYAFYKQYVPLYNEYIFNEEISLAAE